MRNESGTKCRNLVIFTTSSPKITSFSLFFWFEFQFLAKFHHDKGLLHDSVTLCQTCQWPIWHIHNGHVLQRKWLMTYFAKPIYIMAAIFKFLKKLSWLESCTGSMHELNDWVGQFFWRGRQNMCDIEIKAQPHKNTIKTQYVLTLWGNWTPILPTQPQASYTYNQNNPH